MATDNSLLKIEIVNTFYMKLAFQIDKFMIHSQFKLTRLLILLSSFILRMISLHVNKVLLSIA